MAGAGDGLSAGAATEANPTTKTTAKEKAEENSSLQQNHSSGSSSGPAQSVCLNNFHFANLQTQVNCIPLQPNFNPTTRPLTSPRNIVHRQT